MLTTGEAIGILRAIELKVWEHDIPSPGDCPEYRERCILLNEIKYELL